MVDRVRLWRLKIMPEKKKHPYRNKLIGRWLRKRLQGLLPLALSCSLILLPGLCGRKLAQAENIPGVIPVPGTSENMLKEIIRNDSTGVNIVNLTVGTQFLNVATRVNATRNSEEGRRMRGISGEIISDDLYAGLLSDAGFGYNSNTDQSSYFSNLGAFVQGSDCFGDKEITRDPAFDFDNKDVGVGVDYKLTNSLLIGALFNYTNADVDFDNSNENTDTSTRSVSMYGTYNVTNNIYIDGYGMYGWSDIDSMRNMRIATMESDETGIISSTQIDRMLKIKNTGTQYITGVSSGYDLNAGAFTVGPLGRLFYANTDIKGFRKTFNVSDDNAETLEVGAQKTESLTTTLGIDISYAFKTQERLQKIRLGVLIPQVRAEWVHEFMNDSHNLQASLVQANQTVSVATAAPDRDYCKVGLGLSSIFAGGISAYVQYEEILGLSNITSHNIAIGVRVEF